jgi:tRNA (mo5U34)-methyltransferase
MADVISDVSWYHSIALPGGVVTPGLYDLRPAVERSLLPTSLTGLRCLDVGTHDGFWAYEMEKRGAREVMAIDLDDPERYDVRHPQPPIDVLREQVANRRRAFGIAHEALASKVERKDLSVYDLAPEAVGTFDVAYIGTLLHHLRDPIGALAALRRVVTGRLVVNGVFSVYKTVLFPRSPVADVLPLTLPAFWEIPNLEALRRQLVAAGWEIVRSGRPYLQRYGSGWVQPRLTLRPWPTLPTRLILTRGAPHIALLARPAGTASPPSGSSSLAG